LDLRNRVGGDGLCGLGLGRPLLAAAEQGQQQNDKYGRNSVESFRSKGNPACDN
jgi:hypothetical protein